LDLKKPVGLQPSDLIIVAVRPSMGKNDIAMNCCEKTLCCLETSRFWSFSLEMPSEQIHDGMLGLLSRVGPNKFVLPADDEGLGAVSNTMAM